LHLNVNFSAPDFASLGDKPLCFRPIYRLRHAHSGRYYFNRAINFVLNQYEGWIKLYGILPHACFCTRTAIGGFYTFSLGLVPVVLQRSVKKLTKRTLISYEKGIDLRRPPHCTGRQCLGKSG
jgi:hypothetical protein